MKRLVSLALFGAAAALLGGCPVYSDSGNNQNGYACATGTFATTARTTASRANAVPVVRRELGLPQRVLLRPLHEPVRRRRGAKTREHPGRHRYLRAAPSPATARAATPALRAASASSATARSPVRRGVRLRARETPVSSACPKGSRPKRAPPRTPGPPTRGSPASRTPTARTSPALSVLDGVCVRRQTSARTARSARPATVRAGRMHSVVHGLDDGGTSSCPTGLRLHRYQRRFELGRVTGIRPRAKATRAVARPGPLLTEPLRVPVRHPVRPARRAKSACKGVRPNQDPQFTCTTDGAQDACASGSICLHHSCYIACNPTREPRPARAPISSTSASRSPRRGARTTCAARARTSARSATRRMGSSARAPRPCASTATATSYLS